MSFCLILTHLGSTVGSHHATSTLVNMWNLPVAQKCNPTNHVRNAWLTRVICTFISCQVLCPQTLSCISPLTWSFSVTRFRCQLRIEMKNYIKVLFNHCSSFIYNTAFIIWIMNSDPVSGRCNHLSDISTDFIFTTPRVNLLPSCWMQFIYSYWILNIEYGL